MRKLSLNLVHIWMKFSTTKNVISNNATHRSYRKSTKQFSRSNKRSACNINMVVETIERYRGAGLWLGCHVWDLRGLEATCNKTCTVTQFCTAMSKLADEYKNWQSVFSRQSHALLSNGYVNTCSPIVWKQFECNWRIHFEPLKFQVFVAQTTTDSWQTAQLQLNSNTLQMITWVVTPKTTTMG